MTNYVRRYSANHTQRHPRDFDRIDFSPLPKGITISCILFQDGGCTKEGGEWVISTSMGAPVIVCTYHADQICSALLLRGIRYERTPIPRE